MAILRLVIMASFITTVGCSSAVVTSGEGGAGGGPTGTGGEGGSIKLDGIPLVEAGRPRPDDGLCGDSILQRSEQCDDGNTAGSDGCNRLCQVESNWICPEGKPCENLGVCGNGVLTSNKACDDGNTKDGDGCSKDCQQVEMGYICRKAGTPCTPLCGDTLIIATEQCEDGNSDSGDGCSAICRIEPGWTCGVTTPSVCERAVCGNQKVEAGEGCDDGNTIPFDGCSPTCQNDPTCGSTTSAVGECKTTCGDGLLIRGGSEECDDGNQNNGDGCSKDCKVEPGNTCRSAYDNPPEKLEIPVILRDFEGYTNSTPPSGHPDFGRYCCDDSLKKTQGMVAKTLGPDRKPVWAGPNPVADPKQSLFTGKATFEEWYRDVVGVNQTINQTLTLLQNATNRTTYAMNSDTDQPWFDRCGFFPLDDPTRPKVDHNTGNVITYTESSLPGRICQAFEGLGFGSGWGNHNYMFTSELRYFFQYQGNENLKFTGDDDVWVFINGTLAVDMGGVHNKSGCTVILDAANGTGQVIYELPFSSPSTATTVDFKLKTDSVYEVVVLQAERWGGGSNYMLTLANFLAGRSQCGPTCGDGVATGTEECDNGPDNNDSTYGGCTKECKWGPFCGDGERQGEEECDTGKMNGTVGPESTGCSIACKNRHFCGDGISDTDLGEECDLGEKNGLKLDANLQPAPDDSKAQIICRPDCTIPPAIIL
jgi:fibro-slime domain-containing protein